MHKSSMLRMEWFRDNYADKMDENPIKIADIGSKTALGQTDTYRSLFPRPKYEYMGIDMEKGSNVDLAISFPYSWNELRKDRFDIAISGQAFEHMEFPWIAMREMARIVRPGGLVCVIAPSMAPLHRYPVHCQNYFSDGMIALARYACLKALHASTNLAPPGSSSEWYYHDADSMLVAEKPDDWDSREFREEFYKCEPSDLKALADGMIERKDQRYPSHNPSNDIFMDD